MRFTRLFPIIALLALCGPCLGQAAHRNAAMHYQRAFDRFDSLTVDEWIILMNFEGSSATPPQEVRDALRKVQPILNDFHRGSLQPYSDFQLQYSDGLDMMMPHLMPMRQIARLANVDIAVRLYDGDVSGAADRLAALGRSIVHYGDDRVVISSLVGEAVLGLADGAIQMAIDHAALNPGDALTILRPLEQLAAMNDPLNYLEAIAYEYEITVAIGKQIIGGEIAIPDLFAEEPDQENAEKWLSLSEDDFELHVQTFDRFFDGAVEAFSMDDPEQAKAELARLEEEFRAGEHNLLRQFSAVYSSIYESKVRGEEMLEARIASLRELAAGEVDPLEMANAAVWYLRGVTILSEADADAVAALRELNLLWESEIPHAVAALLNDCGERVIEQFRTGSEIRRCDFSIARDGPTHPFVPRYAPGMRDAFRLLHADAIRLMHDGKADEAAKRLAICYRVIGHLGGDEQMLSSLISHVAFEHTHILAEAAVDADRHAAEHVRLLASAFDRIGRADPFGYGGAVRGTRNHGVELIAWYAKSKPKHEAAFTQAADAIRAAGADRLLSLLVLHEEFRHEGRRRALEQGLQAAPVEPRADVAALVDVLSLEDLSTLREESLALAVRLLDGKFDIDEQPRLTSISDIGPRREQARSILRVGAALFHTSEPAAADSATAEEPAANTISEPGGGP